jgi:hypothetical protein
MGLQIIKDGQVIHNDNQVELTEEQKLRNIVERQEKIIQDLHNQIKDLKDDVRFYKVNGG